MEGRSGWKAACCGSHMGPSEPRRHTCMQGGWEGRREQGPDVTPRGQGRQGSLIAPGVPHRNMIAPSLPKAQLSPPPPRAPSQELAPIILHADQPLLHPCTIPTSQGPPLVPPLSHPPPSQELAPIILHADQPLLRPCTIPTSQGPPLAPPPPPHRNLRPSSCMLISLSCSFTLL